MREKAKNTMKRLRDSTEKLIESKKKARLQNMKSRLGMSHDEKAKMREKEKNTMNRLRDSMAPNEKAKMREKAKKMKSRHGMPHDRKANIMEKTKNRMNRLRDGMSSDEKAKMTKKAKNTTKIFSDSMSHDEKVNMREKETMGRKRLRLAKNDLPTIISPQHDFECMKEAKKYLHRTQDPEHAHKHESIICVICDQFIIGTEKIHYLSKDNISAHTQRLSVESYKDSMRQCSFLK
jgi:hypothetical protein